MATNKNKEGKQYLYHGTTLRRLASIVELGLLPPSQLVERGWSIMWGYTPGICLTPNYALAHEYARIKEGASEAVVIKVEVDANDLSEDPDPNHRPRQSFFVTQSIPFERIVGVSTNPDTFEPQSAESLLPKSLGPKTLGLFKVGNIFQLNDNGAVEILDIPSTRTALVRWIDENLYDDP